MLGQNLVPRTAKDYQTCIISSSVVGLRVNTLLVCRCWTIVTRTDVSLKNMKKNMNLFGYTIKKIYNSGYSTEIVNEQCNTGDPLETSGGLYRGPPSMLIYVNTIKCCACETLNLVQCSITMKVKLLQ